MLHCVLLHPVSKSSISKFGLVSLAKYTLPATSNSYLTYCNQIEQVSEFARAYDPVLF